MQKFVWFLSRKLYSLYPRVDSIIPSEPIVDRFTRAIAIDVACSAGNEDCLYDTYALTHLFVDHGRSIPNGLRELVFCNGLKHEGTTTELVELWQIMQASSDADERSLIIRSFGCSSEEAALIDLLQSSIATNSDNNYSRSERLQIFNSVVESPVGVKVALSFIRNHESEGIAQM